MAWRSTRRTKGCGWADGLSTRSKTKAMAVAMAVVKREAVGKGHGQGIGSSGNKVSKKFFLPASGLPTPLIP